MRLFAVILLYAAGLTSVSASEAQPGLPTLATAGTQPLTLDAVTNSQPESPVLFFWRLLAMPVAQREQQLAFKPVSQRKVLLEKLVEYERMRPEERDARLQVLQLRLYLIPLMQTPRLERSNYLAKIPASWRPSVEERLKLWDILPPPLQREVLEKDTTRYYFLRLEASSPAERKAMLNRLSPAKRTEMEQGLKQWRSLSAEQRQNIYKRLDLYLQLTPEEKSRTLGVYSAAEQKQMAATLKTFQTLPKIQREQCLESFQKFAVMSPSDRDQFLANVERWKEMPPEERQTWRALVNALPPLPPGLNPPSFPPLPQ